MDVISHICMDTIHTVWKDIFMQFYFLVHFVVSGILQSEKYFYYTLKLFYIRFIAIIKESVLISCEQASLILADDHSWPNNLHRHLSFLFTKTPIMCGTIKSPVRLSRRVLRQLIVLCTIEPHYWLPTTILINLICELKPWCNYWPTIPNDLFNFCTGSDWRMGRRMGCGNAMEYWSNSMG